MCENNILINYKVRSLHVWEQYYDKLQSTVYVCGIYHDKLCIQNCLMAILTAHFFFLIWAIWAVLVKVTLPTQGDAFLVVTCEVPTWITAWATFYFLIWKHNHGWTIFIFFRNRLQLICLRLLSSKKVKLQLRWFRQFILYIYRHIIGMHILNSQCYKLSYMLLNFSNSAICLISADAFFLLLIHIWNGTGTPKKSMVSLFWLFKFSLWIQYVTYKIQLL